MAVRSIQEVVERQLCTGCGLCSYLEPARFRMGDAPAHGRRPHLQPQPAAETGRALAACPGVRLEHRFDRREPELIGALLPAWGPVLDVWEGHAADPEIRLAGSSGGAATALALYCLEREGMAGVLHAAARRDAAHLNETVLSATRAELLAATGSRYAPASPCDGLKRLERAPGPCVFIGKPCDVAGLQRARRLEPSLDGKLGLAIGFFCAGTPSTGATLELMRQAGVDDPAAASSLRYRGNGWPGMWTVRYTDAGGATRTSRKSYGESWGFLQRHRQWRCYICPDHTGEFADVAVGDPWYREIAPGEPGRSLIVARTRRGREAVLAAAAAGYLVLEARDPSLLPRSQPGLLKTRGRLWAQLQVLRLLGAATPRYRGFATFGVWLRHLSLKEKARSVLGTARRVFAKRLRRRIAVEVRE